LLLVTAIASACPQSAAKASEMNVCRFIVERVSDQEWFQGEPNEEPHPGTGKDFGRDYLIHRGVFDIDGDGIFEQVDIDQTVGTAGGVRYGEIELSTLKGASRTSLWDRMSSEELAFEDEYSRWSFGWAWLPYRGRWYEAGFADEGSSFATVVRYYDQAGLHIPCVFENKVEELSWLWLQGSPAGPDREIVPKPGDPFTTRRLDASGQIPDEAVDAVYTQISQYDSKFQPLGSPFAYWCRASGSCNNVWAVDFDNDGQTDRLLKIGTTSGAGRGCEYSFFVLLTPEDRLDFGPKQKLLLDLQNVSLDDPYPVRPCGLEYDWLSPGKIQYLERHAGGEGPRTTSTLVHDLWVARDGAVRRLSAAVFAVRPTIKYENAPSD
jgi:hypothetical protein